LKKRKRGVCEKGGGDWTKFQHPLEFGDADDDDDDRGG